MGNEFQRTQMLLGEEGIKRLQRAHVAVFGLGGVGSYAVEALARSGVGTLTVVDDDIVDETNINRQLIALHSTVGLPKVDVVSDRIADINPHCHVNRMRAFLLRENAADFDWPSFDAVIDAVDTVTAKVALIQQAKAANCIVLSCMGMGNKIDPSRIQLADIKDSKICPLARIMRHELKKRNIEDVTVVYSDEPVRVPIDAIHSEKAPENVDCKGSWHRQSPGSLAFVPSVAGLILAGEAVRRIANVSP